MRRGQLVKPSVADESRVIFSFQSKDKKLRNTPYYITMAPHCTLKSVLWALEFMAECRKMFTTSYGPLYPSAASECICRFMFPDWGKGCLKARIQFVSPI